MICCDRCEQPIESDVDGYMEYVASSSGARDGFALRVPEQGPYWLDLTIAAMDPPVVADTPVPVPPDCGYHYHTACFAAFVVESLIGEYALITSGDTVTAPRRPVPESLTLPVGDDD